MAAGHRTRAVLTGLAACGLLALTGCGDSGYEYVSNGEAGLFLRVPDSWEVIEIDTDNGQLGRPGVPHDWIRVVDSSPAPTVANYQSPIPSSPVGVAVVEPIETFRQRDDMSIGVLRTYALANYVQSDATDPLAADPLVLDQEADGPVEVVAYDDNITFDGGYRGQRIVFNYEVAEGSFVTIDQTAVIDQDTTEVYRLLIKCEARCYADRQSEIDEIVDSWTIEKD